MKNLITVLSLANLCFLTVWSKVLYPPFNGYHLESPPTGINALAVVFDVLILAAVIRAGLFLVRRKNEKYLTIAARIIFLFLAITALNSLIKEFIGTISLSAITSLFGKSPAIALLAAIISLTFFSLMKWLRQMTKIAQMFILIAFPFVLLTFFQSAKMIVKDGFAFSGEKESAQSETVGTDEPPKTRVVWIIFDEFDYRAAFASRPQNLKLPELDRLAAQSFFAADAFSPTGATVSSIPSLLTGKIVADAQQKSYDELSVRFADTSEIVDWKTQPTIFSDLKNMNKKTALVGWYHPYCRLFADELTKCTSRSNIPDVPPDKHSTNLAESMRVYFWQFGLTVPLVREFLTKYKDFVPDLIYDRNHIEVTNFLTRKAVETTANPEFSFAFIHLPSTHMPYYFDRFTKNFNIRQKTNYFDSLALVDDTIGNMRRAMEENNVWDNSVLIISADHWWRTINWENEGFWSKEEAAIASADKDFRIPFIVKPINNGENHGENHMIYNHGFNSVLTRDLVSAISRGEVSTSREIALWLDRHRSIGRSGY